MKFSILIVFALNMGAFAAEIKVQPIDQNYRDKVVGAIFIAEGGVKTKYPYGIKSIKTNNPKRVCEVTVEKTYIRWQNSGKTNDFISFLGNRFCPIGAKDDPTNLNSNWIKNVKKFIK